MLPPDLPIQEAFVAADEVARQAILGVASLVATNGLINVDFADVRSVMRSAGLGLISIGRAAGEGRAAAAVEAALSSPLLDIRLERVTGCAVARGLIRLNCGWAERLAGCAAAPGAAAGARSGGARAVCAWVSGRQDQA